MRSFFQKFADRPQMESQLENTGGARCFQMESERSAVSTTAHNKLHFGYDERRIKLHIGSSSFHVHDFQLAFILVKLIYSLHGVFLSA